MNRSEIVRRVGEIRWFHTIDLGDGIVTPGPDDSPAKLRKLDLPERLDGMSVLDVGAWDGFFSFEAERRGAARVVAVDSFSWSGRGWGSKEGFDLAHEVLDSRVESREMEVLDISPEMPGTFDVVLFLGVLYHMRHPLLALERVACVARELLVVETEVDLIGMARPAMAFYPGTELNRDPTNWWAPNPSCLLGMLRSLGFSDLRVACRPTPLPIRAARALARMVRRGANPFCEMRRGRMVVHARRGWV